MSAAPELKLDAEACERVAALIALRPRVWERVPAAYIHLFDAVVEYVEAVLRLRRSPVNEPEIERCLRLIDANCQGVLGEVGDSPLGDELSKAVAALTRPARDYVFENVRAGAAPGRLDAEGCKRVATLLPFRPRVWERVSAQEAKDFDEVVYAVETAISLWRTPDKIGENVEGWLAGCLKGIDALIRRCQGALDEKGEKALGDELSGAVAALTSPVRDHLARVRARAHVPAGRNAIVNLLPQEYLILCAACDNTAERLRVLSDKVSFSRGHMLMGSPSFPLERAQELFTTLERKGAATLCELVEREGKREGGWNVNGYCPKCCAFYCGNHYVTETHWSGSWAESVDGTCYKGHKRELA